MKRDRTHQIDDLAQRFLRDSLPPTWVPNEQHRDYAKDYLVEIGENNGELTGSCFFIQLKGKEKAMINANGSLVKCSLESKYARYYVDKVKDLPVFLVVVDVNAKKGWWLFLQPMLEAGQTWLKQASLTVDLPISNDITDASHLRTAVEEAKKWMRLHHPESIHESVIAHKERIIGTDPRFEVDVSLIDDQPAFTLLPKEPVPLTFTFAGDPDDVRKKMSDLLDKGALVAFQPGELKVAGSKLFEQIEQVGCAIRATIHLTGTVTLICRDEEGNELARFSDVPGHFSGGRKEIQFDGGLANSPLNLKIGPIAPDKGGSVQINLDFHCWSGQRLRQLAYFDRLQQFFQALPKSVSTSIDCQQDGNGVFSVTLPLQSQPFASPLACYLDTLSKARKVAQRLNVNPVWTVQAFDRDTQESVEHLYDIFFGNGWSQPMPNVRLTANCFRKTFDFKTAKQVKNPAFIRLTSDCTSMFFGEVVKAGTLAHDYTEMSVKLVNNKRHSARRKGHKGNATSRAVKPPRKDTVEIALVGSQATVRTIRVEEHDGTDRNAVLSPQSNVSNR